MMPKRCPKCRDDKIEKRGELFVCSKCGAKLDAEGSILAHTGPSNRSSNGHSTKSNYGKKR